MGGIGGVGVMATLSFGSDSLLSPISRFRLMLVALFWKALLRTGCTTPAPASIDIICGLVVCLVVGGVSVLSVVGVVVGDAVVGVVVGRVVGKVAGILVVFGVSVVTFRLATVNGSSVLTVASSSLNASSLVLIVLSGGKTIYGSSSTSGSLLASCFL